ncbi:MAG: RNA polymerase subunit sigma-70, partial [Bacteroidia bacterium]|nr:RNA polymerase subunit sigma-70 [Bacteroidia bacterium]
MKKENIASIYNLYVDDLYTYALYLGFDKEIVMDAIHDVFCKLAAEKHLLNEVSNTKFYLFKSLKNRLYDIYKTKRQHVGLIAVDDSREAPFNIQVTIEDKLIDEEEQTRIENQITEMLDSLT